MVFQTTAYPRWFADTNSDFLNAFLYSFLSTEADRSIKINMEAIFRLGTHWLNVEMQQYMLTSVTRSQIV